MIKEQNLFLELVNPRPFRQFPEFTHEDLAGVKSLALKHGMFMLVYSRLEKYAAEFGADDRLKAFLRSEAPLYMQGVICSARQEAVEKKVTGLFRTEGIPSIVFKGNMLAREVYGDPNCRSSCDIDVLIKLKDVYPADRLLLLNGFARVYEKPLEFFLFRIHHAEYRNPGNTGFLELHWHFAIPYFFNISAEEIWSEVEVSPRNKGGCSMTPEMTLIMLLIHHHSHSFRHLKVLVDILWALDRYGNDIDWAALSERLKRAGLANTAYVSCRQIIGLWGELKEIPAVAAFQRSLRGSGLVRPYLLSRYFRPAALDASVYVDYLDKLLKRIAIDKWDRVFLSFARGLFPPRDSIRQYCGENMTMSYAKYLRWIIRSWLQ